MRNLTNQLVALLLAFVTVCSLSLAIVNADNKKEDEKLLTFFIFFKYYFCSVFPSGTSPSGVSTMS